MKTFLAVVLGAVMLAGCAQPKKDNNTITVWHWMADRHKTFEVLAVRYEQQTGIKVLFDLYEPSTYSKKIIASAQAKVLPDIYGILDKKDIFASFINSGFVADLTAEYEAYNSEWKNQLFVKALETASFMPGNVQNVKPGHYGVPIDVTNIQMVYNKNILQQAGVTQLPQTFEQFLESARKISAAGIPVFVTGWGEVWMIDCFASDYAFNIMGEEKIMDTYQGKISYTDPDWIKVFEVFEQLFKNKVLIDGIVTKSNKQAEQDFALERAAFAFNGSWCVNVYHDMNPKLKYGTMLPPAVNPDFPMRIWGGAGSVFVVNNHSRIKDKAIAFLKWLTQSEQQVYLSKETRNLPSNTEALKDIPDILAGFAGAMESITHPAIWEHNENALVSEAFNRGIQSIIIGEKTPLQVAEEVQQVKQRVMKK